MLSAVGCNLKMIDKVGIFTLFKDILFAHGDIIVTLIRHGLDIVEDDAGDVDALEAEAVVV